MCFTSAPRLFLRYGALRPAGAGACGCARVQAPCPIIALTPSQRAIAVRFPRYYYYCLTSRRRAHDDGVDNNPAHQCTVCGGPRVAVFAQFIVHCVMWWVHDGNPRHERRPLSGGYQKYICTSHNIFIEQARSSSSGVHANLHSIYT